ncbi:MAG: hypothetical protein MI807_20310 [Verrucomicrobiales bacterium]|nr:hypothetical protein [Verrucomicrobiales bacterium]
MLLLVGTRSAGFPVRLPRPGLNDPQDSKDFDASVAACLLFPPSCPRAITSDPEIDVIQPLKAAFPPPSPSSAAKTSGSRDGTRPAKNSSP